jgi:hypothetical protein
MYIPGVYQIQSKIKPDRIYIGSAKSIGRRWSKGKKLSPHTEEFRIKQSEGLKKWWKLRKLKNS